MRLSPYIMFRGDCEAALGFYAQCGLGAVTSLMHTEDAPSPPAAEMAGKVMHAEFAGEGVHFFGADSQAGAPMQGVALTLEIAGLAEATRLFDSLAAGGTVSMPLAKQFWGAYFGSLVDKFGVNWLVNSDV